MSKVCDICNKLKDDCEFAESKREYDRLLRTCMSCSEQRSLKRRGDLLSPAKTSEKSSIGDAAQSIIDALHKHYKKTHRVTRNAKN